jgi:hypothetical protein
MHVYRSTNNKPIHNIQLQKSITIYLVHMYCNFFNEFLLLQVENLNLTKNLENHYFLAMLIACKCTPLFKKLDMTQKVSHPILQPFSIEWANSLTNVGQIFTKFYIQIFCLGKKETCYY